MAENETEVTTKQTLPVVPYKTFRNFVEGLKVGIPDPIDKSVMSTMSGATQTQMMATLRFLGLIEADGTPAQKLHDLVDSYEDGKPQVQLQVLLTAAYPALFNGRLKLETVSPAALREAFADLGVQGDTGRKAMAFFLHAATAADIKLSTHLRGGRRFKTSSARPKPVGRSLTANASDAVDVKDSVKTNTGVGVDGWKAALLDKFPAFNPEWPEEVQAKWFESFGKLMDLKKDS
jgi:hypothetical protein